MMPGFKRAQDRFEMKVSGQGNHGDVTRRHRGERLFVGFERRPETPLRESLPDCRGSREVAQRALAARADRPAAQEAEPLELIERWQDLVVHDHAAAHDGDFHRHRPAVACRSESACTKASSSTAVLSTIASSVITRGGAIFTVPPPKPTGENRSTPFSQHSRTTSHARSPSGLSVPG